MPGSRQVRRLNKRERDQLRERLGLVQENSNVHIDEIRDHEEIEADQVNLEVGQDNLELGEENLEVHEKISLDYKANVETFGVAPSRISELRHR